MRAESYGDGGYIVISLCLIQTADRTGSVRGNFPVSFIKKIQICQMSALSGRYIYLYTLHSSVYSP